jgi:small subunit ribosomal protein S17
MSARTFEGRVKSNKMTKTLVVVVTRQYQEGRTGKIVYRDKKYKVHSENDKVNEGDLVLFSECRPISKEKKFRLIKVTKESPKAFEANLDPTETAKADTPKAKTAGQP